jgi:predicted small lipoprotein YifL
LTALSDPLLARIALVGALLVALGVAGCGRKGGLDPPPAAAVPEPAPIAADAPPPVGPDGRPVLTPPPPPRRSTPIDWLID